MLSVLAFPMMWHQHKFTLSTWTVSVNLQRSLVGSERGKGGMGFQVGGSERDYPT